MLDDTMSHSASSTSQNYVRFANRVWIGYICCDYLLKFWHRGLNILAGIGIYVHDRDPRTLCNKSCSCCRACTTPERCTFLGAMLVSCLRERIELLAYTLIGKNYETIEYISEICVD